MHELRAIKLRRKKLGLTQKDLADASRVSQSLIAKIESNRIEPSYSNAVRIFDTLSRIESKNNACAKDLVHKKIFSVSSDADISDIIRMMKNHEISQIPVVDKGNVQGYVSESIILDAFTDGRTSLKAKDIMEEIPILPEHTSKNIVISILQQYPIVLVANRKKLIGVITKSDLLSHFT